MNQMDAPYVFSAFTRDPSCAAEAQTCNRVNFFADAEQPNLYARAFVVPQAYSNCALPSQSLHNGHFLTTCICPIRQSILLAAAARTLTAKCGRRAPALAKRRNKKWQIVAAT